MAHTVSDIFRLALPDQFRAFEHSLRNTEHEEISRMLTIYLYNSERINIGKEKNSYAEKLYHEQKKQYARQISTTEKLHTLKRSVLKQVKTTWKIAQMAVEDPALKRSLGIHRPLLRSLQGWVGQFDRFYRNITPEILVFLKEFGYTKKKLATEQALVKTVAETHKEQIDITSEAQRATADRDEAVADLHRWMRRFYKISKLSMAEEPESLIRLGIRPRR